MQVLAIGDSVRLQTGYGRVSAHVLGNWAHQGHMVNQLAWGHFEPPEKGMVLNPLTQELIGIINIFPPYTKDQFATESTVNWIEKMKPDIVYNSNDFFTSSPLVARRKTMKEPFFLVNYGVIDAIGSAEAYAATIEQVNVPVTPSKFGFEQLRKVTDRGIYIPHGVDLDVYKPSPISKDELKKKYNMKDKFVFGVVNRNITRKQIPMIYECFSNLKYKHGLKDIVLMPITDPFDSSGYNLHEWAVKYKLSWSWNLVQADVMYHPQHLNYIMSLSDFELAEAFNLFDVTVSATMSEGFGLSTLESEACGTPVIIPKHSANIELVEGHGWLTDTAKKGDGSDIIISSNQAEVQYGYPYPDQYSLEMAMLDAYNNREKIATNSKLCLDFVKDYSWPKVLPLWDEVIKRAEDWKRVMSK